MEATSLNTVTLDDSRVAILGAFNALDGYDIRSAYIDMLEKRDKKLSRQFLIRVLEHVTVDGQPLNEKTVDKQLKTWQNVHLLVTSCLAYNGITEELVAREKASECEAMGKDMATGFMAAMQEMYGPMIEVYAAAQLKE